MSKWIKTKAVFQGDFEDLGIKESLEDRLAPFRFDLNEVVAYNESSTRQWATIWLMGTTITITMSVDELDELLERMCYNGLGYVVVAESKPHSCPPPKNLDR